jgi:putative salt-induced outer membrane protein YdiY
MRRDMRRPSLPRVAAALLALTAAAAPRPALAQVNIEALRSDIDDRLWWLSLQASYQGHAGNVNGSVASGAGFAGFNRGRHQSFVKLQLDYAQFSGTSTVSKAFAHARYVYRILPWLMGEVFVQVEQDKFQRLAIRQLDGVGPRFRLVQHPIVQLYLGTSWMLDYEKLADGPGMLAPFPGARWVAQRWSNYASLSLKLGSRARFADAVYVQPRFNGFHDYRFFNDASFAVDIDRRFSAKISCQAHYNSAPPSRVGPTDVDTLTSLVLTL